MGLISRVSSRTYSFRNFSESLSDDDAVEIEVKLGPRYSRAPKRGSESEDAPISPRDLHHQKPKIPVATTAPPSTRATAISETITERLDGTQMEATKRYNAPQQPKTRQSRFRKNMNR